MCTVLLPPGVNPIAVNKYIISYHIIISYHLINNHHESLKSLYCIWLPMLQNRKTFWIWERKLRVTRLPTPKSQVQVNTNIFDDCTWAGDKLPGTHFCEISSYGIRDNKCHFKVYCTICFLMKGTCVCCRNMSLHHCSLHSL